MPNELTQKQDNFCKDISLGVLQGESYTKNYNTKNMSQGAIDVEACRLAALPKISLKIEELRKEHRRSDVADFEERQKILTEISRGKLSQFTDDAGVIDRKKLDSSAIQGIDEQTVMGRLATVIKIKLHNPIQAISELNKMDHVYETGQGVAQFSGPINILVLNEKTKGLLERVKGGERTTKLIENEVIEGEEIEDG